MRKLTLVAEYLTSPIFDHSVEHMGPVELSELPLSISLVKEIEEWDRIFQATLCQNYPPHSRFKIEEELQIFNEKGYQISIKLQQELKQKYEITYVPQSW
ncbi:hypothetical protein [Glaciimonas sp. PAMC28666]|uniref:hypothetical protein n=1 Tax=Glaciimonas sp. PAMC28666 TaxID=2807626 RepID=UPI0019665A9F|nr:hypothetical protein [Glaciimonas sp. PAMC28666]QRX84370.1 hypothetical protein JQN73_09420 [Glaciimonas sp. PAMC28666]